VLAVQPGDGPAQVVGVVDLGQDLANHFGLARAAQRPTALFGHAAQILDGDVIQPLGQLLAVPLLALLETVGQPGRRLVRAPGRRGRNGGGGQGKAGKGGSRRLNGKGAGRLQPPEQDGADVFAVAAPGVGATALGADAARRDLDLDLVHIGAAHLGAEGLAGAHRVVDRVQVAARLA